MSVAERAWRRRLAERILSGHGYTVLVAGRAEEARGLVRAHPHPIHLLLSDVVMPEVSGPALAAELVALRPAMRVLFMSGYADDAIVRHGVLEPGLAFLQKPLTPEAQARRVREALDGHPPGMPPPR